MKIVTRADAIKAGLTHYFTGKECVHGHITTRRVKDRKCMGCDIADKALLRTINNEKVKTQRTKAYYNHREKALATKKVYRQNNKGKVNALNAARKKHIKQRTPVWLSDFDKLKIQCMYSVAAMLTRENKEAWHVDHILPLQGDLVSGLHVPANLQLMRGLDNISKKNRYEVTYA